MTPGSKFKDHRENQNVQAVKTFNSFFIPGNPRDDPRFREEGATGNPGNLKPSRFQLPRE
jgi:hypothetical protein